MSEGGSVAEEHERKKITEQKDIRKFVWENYKKHVFFCGGFFAGPCITAILAFFSRARHSRLKWNGEGVKKVERATY